jgi:PhnB protein
MALSKRTIPMSDDMRRDKNKKTAIAPMLSVRRGAQAIEFYKAAFGADEVFRIDSDDGHVVVQLSVAGAEF